MTLDLYCNVKHVDPKHVQKINNENDKHDDCMVSIGTSKTHNIIDSCQIGFTRKARSSDHMFILKSIIDNYCKSKDGRVFACFVDFQKAFDTVIHTGIKIKLLEIGVGSFFL